MKNLMFIILLFSFGITNAQEKSKEIKTAVFNVQGNCEHCKKRIENAAFIKGVKLAEWDAKSQQIKVTYRADKVSEEQIKEAIVKAGHDIDNTKASKETYDKLPACCKYRKE